MRSRPLLAGLSLILLVACLTGCLLAPTVPAKSLVPSLASDIGLTRDGYYTEAEDVAAYLRQYQLLPGNFITKQEAAQLGWESHKGNLWEVTDRQSIGGDEFANREGRLPQAEGRRYFECDINYQGGFRGPERLVYSNDGLIFCSRDHYQTFEQLD